MREVWVLGLGLCNLLWLAHVLVKNGGWREEEEEEDGFETPGFD